MYLGQESAKLGKKVAIVDFVSKSPYGSTWGLGGFSFSFFFLTIFFNLLLFLLIIF